MIDSIVNLFANNQQQLSAKKSATASGNDSFSQYDAQIFGDNNRQQEQVRFDEPKKEEFPTEENNDKEDDVDDDGDSSEENDNCHGLTNKDNLKEKNTKKTDEPSVQENNENLTEQLTPFFNLLENIGLDKSALEKLKELLDNTQKILTKEDVSDFLKSLKLALNNKKNVNIPTSLLEKVTAFAEKIAKMVEPAATANSAELRKVIQQVSTPKSASTEKITPQNKTVEDEIQNEKQVQTVSSKFHQMRQISQEMSQVRFTAEGEAKTLSGNSNNTFQQLHLKNLQTNTLNPSAPTTQQGGQQQQNNSEAQSENLGAGILQKMKAVLKSNNSSSSNDTAVVESSKAQVQNFRTNLLANTNANAFVQQLISKIQTMTRNGSTLSAQVDFKSTEFGDLKLAAESLGNNLMVKLSHLSMGNRHDLNSLRNELTNELKALGFENIDLDFGDESGTHQGKGFEDEMQKRLSGEFVKLPGDQIADLKAIDEWMIKAKKAI